MSFSFYAVGTREEVAAQLEHADVSVSEGRFNEFGAELKTLLVKHFEAETVHAGRDFEYRYVVKASGHGGGSAPLSVQLTIEPLHTRRTEPRSEVQAEPEAAENHTGD